jgi:tRNA(Ile)-lysidine synthase TilS/MesJ
MGSPKMNNSMWYVMKRIGKAIFNEEMLGPEAPVLVGLSGGFASMALLKGLVERRKRVPYKHPVVPAFVYDGVHGPPDEVAEVLKAWCKTMDLDLLVDKQLQPNDNHFDPVPHGWRLAALARQAGAPYIALGHTVVDRAVGILEAMVCEGVVRDAPTRESLITEDGDTYVVVRPVSLITSQAVLDAATDEFLPYRARQVAPPGAELKNLLGDFVINKKGAPLEKLMNVVNAPGRIHGKYMA